MLDNVRKANDEQLSDLVGRLARRVSALRQRAEQTERERDVLLGLLEELIARPNDAALRTRVQALLNSHEWREP